MFRWCAQLHRHFLRHLSCHFCNGLSGGEFEAGVVRVFPSGASEHVYAHGCNRGHRDGGVGPGESESIQQRILATAEASFIRMFRPLLSAQLDIVPIKYNNLG